MANLMSYFQKGFEDGYKNADEIQRNSIARAAAQLGLNELHDAYLINSNLIPERHLQAKTKIEADTIDDLYRAKSTVATMPFKDAYAISQAQNEVGKNQLETEIRNNTWAAQLGAGQREANAAYHLAGSGEILAGAQFQTNENNRGMVQAISDNQLGTSYTESKTAGVQAKSGLFDAQTQQAVTAINRQIAPLNEQEQLAYLSRILTSGVYSEKQKQGAAVVLAQIKEKKEQAAAELLKAGGKVVKSPEQLAAEQKVLMQIELQPAQVAASLGMNVQPKQGGGYTVQERDYAVKVQKPDGSVVDELRKGFTYEVKDMVGLKALLARAAGVPSETYEKLEQFYHRPQNAPLVDFGFGGGMYGGGNGSGQ